MGEETKKKGKENRDEKGGKREKSGEWVLRAM